MRFSLKHLATSMGLTLLFLLILEIFSTAFLPALGMIKYRLSFNVLIILFLGFRVETPFLPILILLVQFLHSGFSIEGWAYGTFAGIIVSIGINYVKELLDFSTAIWTIILTQIFQILWFFITSILIFMRTQEWHFIAEKFWHFIPESMVLSLLAPPFFLILTKIWRLDRGENMGVNP